MKDYDINEIAPWLVIDDVIAAFDELKNIEWRYPWLKDITNLCLEYLQLDGLEDADRIHDIPFAILEIAEHVLKQEEEQ